MSVRATRRGERGAVLLIVTVLGLLAMAVWGLAWRATHDAIRVEGFVVQRDARARSVLPALAHGIALLRLGHPPTDPYECIDTVADGAETHACTLVFTSQGSSETWRVDARLATEEEQSELPPMPATFTDQG